MIPKNKKLTDNQLDALIILDYAAENRVAIRMTEGKNDIDEDVINRSTAWSLSEMGLVDSSPFPNGKVTISPWVRQLLAWMPDD